MKIIIDDLAGPEVKALLADHLQSMADHSPPDCVHALDHEKLRAPNITFWSVWDDDELLGCGALKELDPSHGEIKSMRTAAVRLGKGVGSALDSLYLKFGFEFCGPFADYAPGSFTRFMTLRL